MMACRLPRSRRSPVAWRRSRENTQASWKNITAKLMKKTAAQSGD
jgi:hypothetical protein